jgi:hypothetical protein
MTKKKYYKPLLISLVRDKIQNQYLLYACKGGMFSGDPSTMYMSLCRDFESYESRRCISCSGLSNS